MFFNLAWRNSKRSRNENLIYFLTMVTAVAAFYIVLSLGAQDVIRFLSSLESDAVERLLTNLLPTVYVCALLFVFFLVVFANKYQLECRSRELGLYLMFGMTKTRLFTQIMTEGLITSLVALLGGLICGGFLSEVISLATARLVGHGVIAHQSSFSLSAVFFTILGFLIIQCVALFILCGKLFKKEVHQLLYGEMGKKQHTGSTHGSLLSLVIGTAVLLVAYWVVIEHFMTGGGVMLLVAVLLGIVGTILFIRGIARLLSIVAASNKRKATNGLYVFTLRQLHENVVYKYISISVASILMMLMVIDDTEEALTLSDDRIEKAVRQNRVRLVIIDPVQAFIGADVDMNRANEVRPVFRKLGMIAEKTGCAIVLIGHLNKSSGTQSTYRGLGSIDIMAAVRSLIFIGKVRKDPTTRVLIHEKSSLAPPGETMAFKLGDEEGFRWVGAYEISADELLDGKEGKATETKLERGAKLIRELLADKKEISIRELDEKAKEQGISGRTMRDVRSRMKNELEYQVNEKQENSIRLKE